MTTKSDQQSNFVIKIIIAGLLTLTFASTTIAVKATNALHDIAVAAETQCRGAK